MTYRPEIDGMRALAVGLVILFHAGFSLFSGGFIGVDVFFVISGYLITRIIHGELQEGRFSIGRFYERRARRILPALFLVMAAILPASFLIMLPSEREALSEAMVATTLFSSNILFWLRSSYFDVASELNALLHTWSLAVEEQFYIIFPLLLMALVRASKPVLVAIIAVLCLMSLVAAELIVRSYPGAAFYLIPFRAWELGAGALIALTLGSAQIKSRQFAEPLSLLGLALILYGAFTYDTGTPFPGLYAVPPVLGTCLIITCATPQTLTGRLLSLKPMIWIGLISYSAYLWHQPLFAFARLSAYHELDLATIWALIGATFVLAWLSWKFVETPFRNGKRITVPRLAGALTPVAAALFAFGLAGNYTKGFAGENTHVDTNGTLFFDLYSARLDAIQSGICHFNGRGEHTTVDAFIENWSCDTPPASEDAASIAIFGDSVAADLAAALRFNGVSPLQLTGAGCSLSPRLQTPNCRKLHTAFLERIEAGDIDEIWVTNWFEPDDLKRADFEEAIAALTETGLPVRILAPLPNFGAVRRAHLASLMTGKWPEGLRSDKQAEKVLTFVSTLSLPDTVTVVDTRPFFCSLAVDCHLVDGDTLLMIDKRSHLTEAGLRAYGAALKDGLLPLQGGAHNTDLTNQPSVE